MNAQVPPTYPRPPYAPASPQLYHAAPQHRPYYATPPAQPYAPAPPAPPYWPDPRAYYYPRASVTYVPRQTSHGLHLFLTIVTGGAWGLVWLGVALAHRYGARQDVRTYHA